MDGFDGTIPLVDDFTTGDLRRFCAKVAMPADPIEGCWEWTAGQDGGGYGTFAIGGGRATRAHRLAAWLALGPPPPGRPLVLHSCDNPPCVNPCHLRYGTYQDNADDREQRDRGAYGERHIASKLRAVEVQEIREAHAAGSSIAALARLYCVGEVTVHSIVHRRSWRRLV